jgi:hypothetical protein
LINPGTETITIRQRRMQVLAPYIAEITTDVPPPAPQFKVLDRISAKQVANKLSKQEKKALKEQEKRKEKEDKGKGIKEESGESEGKLEKKALKQLEKRKKKGEKTVSKEGKQLTKMEYIVVSLEN